MAELIKIQHKDGKQIVSARDLYELLEIKKDFTSWCKSMFEYGFTEGVDYVAHFLGEPDNQIVKNPKPKIDYALVLDCAKEISMIQRTEQGKKARLYFIECEKRVGSLVGYRLPVTYADALRQLADETEAKEKLEKELEKAKPKIDFFNQVADSKDAIDLGSAAKVLNQGIGRNKLFEFLRENNILMNNNLPYQEYSDRGWFRVVEQKYNKPDGSVHINTKTLVYQKGLQGISRLLEKNTKKI